jgi:hypothetical protein
MEKVPGCPLAVRVNDRTLLVKGSHIDDHGDAHADDGLCNRKRLAEVTGRIDGEHFAATSFRLVD